MVYYQRDYTEDEKIKTDRQPVIKHSCKLIIINELGTLGTQVNNEENCENYLHNTFKNVHYTTQRKIYYVQQSE